MQDGEKTKKKFARAAVVVDEAVVVVSVVVEDTVAGSHRAKLVPVPAAGLSLIAQCWVD